MSSELPRLWITGSGVVRSRFSSAWFLRVRLADLDAVDARVLVERHVGGIEDLDDRRQPERAPGLDDEREPAAERVRVADAPRPSQPLYGLERYLTTPPRSAHAAGLLHQAGRLHDLRLALDRARAGDDRQRRRRRTATSPMRTVW